MSDAHSHTHAHAHDSARNIRTAFFLNLGFTLVEIVGGVLTNSLAIVADALHDLGDSFSIGLAWYMETRARRPGTGAYSYGFRRLSLLAALVNAVVLVGGSLFILTLALPRLLNPEQAHAGGMLVLAVFGILVNGAAVLRLRGGKTMNAQVITWHLLEDVLGWVAVLVVGIALLVTDFHVLDPLLSILITGYVLYNVLRNLKKTVALFLQAAPPGVDMQALERALAAIPGVAGVHHTHVWSLDGEKHVFTTHLVVAADASKAEILQVKCAALRALEQSDLEHTTIEVEYADEQCRMNST